MAGVDRALGDAHNYAADNTAAQEREDDDGDGLGSHAAPRRVRTGAERRDGHSAHDAHGLRQIVFARALAHLWGDAGYLSVRLFSGPRLCRRLHVAEYVPVLYDGRVHLLGGDHGRQSQSESW